MLGELAITPDVYLESAFPDAVSAAVVLECLRDPVLHECLVRDLYEGGLSKSLRDSKLGLSPRAKEFLKKVARRFRPVPKMGSKLPENDLEWCQEALASASALPLDCIVTTPETYLSFLSHALVCDATKIRNHKWHQSRGPSITVKRSTDGYLAALDRILVASNSLMFIDPHLDPLRHGYDEFYRLLERCHRPAVPVRVEIHRVCYESSGKDRRILGIKEIRARFEKGIKRKLEGVNVLVDVYVWDDFHDRYLISDLLGLLLGNGFDVSRRPDEETTWGRLSSFDRDTVQRKFDPSRCPSDTNRGYFVLMP